MLLAQALYPAMLERGSGHLVFVASLSGKSPSPRSSIYNATKFGLRGFALGLRADLGPQGVGVSLVSPGFIREAGMFADVRRQAAARAGHRARPEQVARRRGQGDRARQGRGRGGAAAAAGRSPTSAWPAPASRCALASGAAGQKAAAEVAAGHLEGQEVDTTTLEDETMSSSDSFGARSTLEVSGRDYEVFRLDALQERFDVARLPYSIKVLLENVLRLEDGVSVSAADVEAIAGWDAAAEPSVEIPFQPARVLMQDFTGVPAVVDLAAMRDAMEEIGGDPAAINPLVDVDLVIDHSVQVDAFGNAARLRASTPSATSSATASATRSSSGASTPSTTSAWCRRRPGSATRSTSSTWPRSSTAARPTASCAPTPTPWSAPTRTRRWSTASACSAGASAGSRPRRRCSASRSRCCCRRWSASSSAASCRRGRPRPTSSSP